MTVDEIFNAIEALSDEDMRRLFFKLIEAMSAEANKLSDEKKAEVRHNVKHLVAEYI